MIVVEMLNTSHVAKRVRRVCKAVDDSSCFHIGDSIRDFTKEASYGVAKIVEWPPCAFLHPLAHLYKQRTDAGFKPSLSVTSVGGGGIPPWGQPYKVSKCLFLFGCSERLGIKSLPSLPWPRWNTAIEQPMTAGSA